MLCAVLYGVRALWCAIGAYGTAAGGLGPCVVCGVWCVCACVCVRVAVMLWCWITHAPKGGV